MAIPKTSSVPQPMAGHTTTSTSSTTTTTEAKPKATLKLISLLCERRNDLFGVDEASIWVNGQKVWAHTIEKGETVSLVPQTVDFEGVATVVAKERDGENYQKIGTPSTLTPPATIRTRWTSRPPAPTTSCTTTSTGASTTERLRHGAFAASVDSAGIIAGAVPRHVPRVTAPVRCHGPSPRGAGRAPDVLPQSAPFGSTIPC